MHNSICRVVEGIGSLGVASVVPRDGNSLRRHETRFEREKRLDREANAFAEAQVEKIAWLYNVSEGEAGRLFRSGVEIGFGYKLERGEYVQ